MIALLDQKTINQIAAGEVIERPSSVVKELVENSVDSGASAITVEIKEGGLSFIRITDNGSGIPKEEVRQAFLRHATSKITRAEDLLHISSLGFRGEALASIAAVAQVELVTKTKGSLTGCRFEIHGGKEQSFEEIGCPEGTTVIVRNLFYNTPARKKFMKSAMTEGGYIQELVTRLAMSKPHIAMQFILNGQNKLSTPGNGRLKEVIYQVYGRDITANLLEVDACDARIKMYGYIGKPFISRGNRLFENYFVNGRYMKNSVVTKAIEEAYRTFVMVHKFPFTALCLELEPSLLDINVHPTKMEMRYQESDVLYRFICRELREALLRKELIPAVTVGEKKAGAAAKPQEKEKRKAEPFEVVRRAAEKKEEVQTAGDDMPITKVAEDIGGYTAKAVKTPADEERLHLPWQEFHREQQPRQDEGPQAAEGAAIQSTATKAADEAVIQSAATKAADEAAMQSTVAQAADEAAIQSTAAKAADGASVQNATEKHEQMNLFEEQMISEEAGKKHRLIGQLFKTYWLIEYENKLFIMDQHAAHEKVMYERLMRKLMHAEIYSQQIYPPKVVSLSPSEENALQENMQMFERMGFSVESFGGREYMLRAVPEDIFGIPADDVFFSLIADLSEEGGVMSEEIFVVKLSSMACKAAVKGNTILSFQAAEALIDELLTLENPYNCPHGRPTMISMSERELEKKFKRIQS